jgi:hypothetical protein
MRNSGCLRVESLASDPSAKYAGLGILIYKIYKAHKVSGSNPVALTPILYKRTSLKGPDSAGRCGVPGADCCRNSGPALILR